MAMRSRGGGGGGAGARRGTRAGVVQSVYEDFKPVSEWQQDDESHVLNIYLPGFMKEQIRITTEGRNTIRARGERLVAGNKWSRFLEDYQVPENGEMNSVRAKFQGGILRVTVPKEGVGKPQDDLPPETRDIDEIRKQPAPRERGQVKAIPEVKGGKEPQKQPIQIPETRDVDEIRKQPAPRERGQVKAIPEVKGGKEPQKQPIQIPETRDVDEIRKQPAPRERGQVKAIPEVKGGKEPQKQPIQIPETRDVDEIRKQPAPRERGQVKAIPEVKGGKEPQKQPIQIPETRDVDEIRKQPTPQKGGQVKAIPEVKGGKEPQMRRGHDGNQKQPIPPQKGLDKPLPQVGTSQSTEEKSIEPVKASADPNNNRDLDGDHRGRRFTPLRSTRNEVSQDPEKEESSENQRGRSFTPTRITRNVINQNAEKKESGDVTKEKVHKESKEAMGGSELPEAETTKTKESEKSRATGIPEKTADNRDSYGAPKQQNYKKAVKGLTELNEERQLLVNMGVAMLVIVALTAYVTLSFASAKHQN